MMNIGKLKFCTILVVTLRQKQGNICYWWSRGAVFMTRSSASNNDTKHSNLVEVGDQAGLSLEYPFPK